MDKLIHFIVDERVAYITLNRPEKRNSLSPELVSELTTAFVEAAGRDDVKVVVLKGAGEVFSAGVDLAYLQQLQQNTFEENVEDSSRLKDLFQTIYSFPKVVIAQVEGHAIAGGCGLAAVCDIVFSVPDARFGYTEVKIGFIPALVSCYLVRKLGEGRTKELLLSGELISATTAESYGLINFVVPREAIAEKVRQYAHNLCTGTSAQSISQTKALLQLVQDSSLEEGLQAAVTANAEARATDDCKKGIASFLNKERLSW